MNIPNKNAVIFTVSKGFVSEAILFAQSIETTKRYGKLSQWSHIRLLGCDGRCYESTVVWNFKQNGIVYGVRSVGRNKLLKDLSKVKAIGLQTFNDLTDENWEQITKYAALAEKKGTLYGGIELLGTLWTILKWRFAAGPERDRIMREKNPFNSEAVYCVAFVADCFLRAGINYTSPGIDTSNLTVDDAWFGCQLQSRFRIVKCHIQNKT